MRPPINSYPLFAWQHAPPAWADSRLWSYIPPQCGAFSFRVSCESPPESMKVWCEFRSAWKTRSICFAISIRLWRKFDGETEGRRDGGTKKHKDVGTAETKRRCGPYVSPSLRP